jgi:DNA polymerase-3 subunit chi
VVVLFDDDALLPKFDDLLWTFGDGSFVPHDFVPADGAPSAPPVALTTGPQPAGHADVLIKLGQNVPQSFEKFVRVAEFLDARPEVRAAGRERFKAYRGKSIEPQTHTV